MKQRDTVRIVGHTLVTHFVATGETRRLTSIDLKPGVSFRVASADDGAQVIADLHSTGAQLVLECFAAERLAESGFDRVQATVSRHLRLQLVLSALRGLVKYVLVPVGVLLIGLAMNVAVHPEFGRSALASPTPSPVIAPPLPVQPTATPSPGPSAAQIAQALAQGAASKKYTVQLGSGDKGTLFVFEDPLCPHCQDFAPELEKLAKDHTVYVFPVSVIGGQDAAIQSATVLCESDPAKRVAAWNTAQTKGLPTDKLRDQCLAAVTANDDIFRVMGLQGTPTVISASGKVMPYSVPAEAAAIAAWLSQAG